MTSFVLFYFFFSLASSFASDCSEISFTWSALPNVNPQNTGAPSDSIGYYVYYGSGPADPYVYDVSTGVGNPSTPGPFTVVLTNKIDVGSTPVLDLTGLDPTQQYYFQISAYNSSLQETQYGNQFTEGTTASCAGTPLAIQMNVGKGLVINGIAGSYYSIEQSFDLVTWVPVAHVMAPTDQFTYPVDFSAPHAFFRVKRG